MPRISAKLWRQIYAPEGMRDEDIIIPPRKRKKDPHQEWRLQARCVILCREAEKLFPDFWFMAPGALSFLLDKKKAAFAKMQGYRRGVLDIWLVMKLENGFKIATVELKRTDGKGSLTKEQRDFFKWAPWPCHKCDDYEAFSKIVYEFVGMK